MKGEGLGFLKNHRWERNQNFLVKMEGVVFHIGVVYRMGAGKYCFSSVMCRFCSSNALCSAIILFRMFVFILILFDT